jgi:hypothetical protein
MSDRERDRYEGFTLFLRLLLRFRVASEAGEILTSLSSMRDPRQGAVYLGTLLAPLPPESIVSALDALLDAAVRKDPGADVAVQAILSPLLRRGWREGLSLQVQGVAREEGRFDLAAMLLELPEMDERFVPPPAPVPKELEDVPLGLRKAWARRPDINMMERLLSDPDPAVIANLLDNPRLTVREVVRLASERKAGEEILEAIALHPRWIARYEVKVTLAHNPSTPVRITLGLLRLLMSQDLEVLAEDSRLSGVVTGRIRRMLGEGGALSS